MAKLKRAICGVPGQVNAVPPTAPRRPASPPLLFTRHHQSTLSVHGGRDAPGNLGACPSERVPREMGVSGRGRRLGMAEERADHGKGEALRDRNRSKAVGEVVDRHAEGRSAMMFAVCTSLPQPHRRTPHLQPQVPARYLRLPMGSSHAARGSWGTAHLSALARRVALGRPLQRGGDAPRYFRVGPREWVLRKVGISGGRGGLRMTEQRADYGK
jgi:hypothetical protein